MTKKINHPDRVCRNCGEIFRIGHRIQGRTNLCQGPLLESPEGKDISKKFTEERMRQFANA